MRKLKLSRMKRNSLRIPRFTEQNHGSKAGWPDSKVLSSTTLCIHSRNLPQGGQGRGAHVEGRLVIKARKIHDLLGNYLTDHSPHVVSQQWNWGSGINSPTSLSTPPSTFSHREPILAGAQPLTHQPCVLESPFQAHSCCNRHSHVHLPSLNRPVTTEFLGSSCF